MPDGNRSSGGPQSLAFTDAERAFLENGTLGGYRRSRLENQVRTKVQALPDRLSRLENDIDLIPSSDYLDSEIRKQAWKGLLREATPRYIERPEDNLTRLYTQSQPLTPLQGLGRFIGGITHDLLRNPADIDREELLAHVILGFIQGVFVDTLVVGRVEKRGFDTETEQMLERVQSLASEIEEQRTGWDVLKETLQSTQRLSRVATQLRGPVQEILFKEGVVDSRPPAELSLQERMVQIDNEGKEKQEFDQGEDESDTEILTAEKMNEMAKEHSRSVVRKTVNHLIAAEGKGDSIPGTFGAVQEFGREHDVTGFDPEEFATRDAVMDIYQNRRISGRIGLDIRLESDSDRLESHRWRGVEGSDVFRVLYREGPSSSRRIAQNINSRKQKTSQVTRVARDLAGDECSDRDVWDELPILQGDNNEWRLTSYGEVLAHYKFDHNHWSIDALPDSLIYQGIDELADNSILCGTNGAK